MMANNGRVRYLTRIALAAAFMCVLSPLALPLGAFPLTLASFCLYLIALAFSPLEGFLTLCIYLAVGFLGLPVFSGFAGGVQVLVSPTGGFLLAYPFAAFLISLIGGFDRTPSLCRRILALLSGMILLYIGGFVGYILVTGVPLNASLFLVFLPFLLGDFVKIAASLIVFTRLTPILKKTA